MKSGIRLLLLPIVIGLFAGCQSENSSTQSTSTSVVEAPDTTADQLPPPPPRKPFAKKLDEIFQSGIFQDSLSSVACAISFHSPEKFKERLIEGTEAGIETPLIYAGSRFEVSSFQQRVDSLRAVFPDVPSEWRAWIASSEKDFDGLKKEYNRIIAEHPGKEEGDYFIALAAPATPEAYFNALSRRLKVFSENSEYGRYEAISIISAP